MEFTYKQKAETRSYQRYWNYKDTISQFGRRNQMSSSNILSIHGLKKKHQFQDSNRDIQW